MGEAIVRVSTTFLEDFLMGNVEQTESDAPSDIEIIGARFSLADGAVHLKVRSAELENVRDVPWEARQLPELKITHTRIDEGKETDD